MSGPNERDEIAAVLAKVAQEHEYVGDRLSMACDCGFTVDPREPARDRHQAHVTGLQADALGLRVERSVERGASPPIHLRRWVGAWERDQ